MYVEAASRPRCLAVAIGLTATLWGVAAVLVRTARGQAAGHRRTRPWSGSAWALWPWPRAGPGCRSWPAWPTPGAARPATCTGGVRRLALAACGVALASALAAPAQAGTEGPRSDPLSGLPLPERAEGHAHPRHHQVVVRPGDTLWALAEHDLPAPATDRQVSVRWHAVYRRNRGVIGPDPDLIRPGQVLKLTKEQP